MSSSLENKCESAVMAILAATSGLTTFSIVHKDEDEQAEKNRIVVNAHTYETALQGINAGRIKVFRVPISIELYYVTRDEAAYDTIISAINGALLTACAGQIPDAAAVAWIASFGSLTNASLEQTDEGEDETDSNTRTRTKPFHFLVLNV
jgi:hypothetical protein